MQKEKPVTKGEMIDAIAALHVIKDAAIRNNGDFSSADRKTFNQSHSETSSQSPQNCDRQS